MWLLEDFSREQFPQEKVPQNASLRGFWIDSGSAKLLSIIPYETHSLENPEATFLLSVTSMLSIQASEG